jgi:hypothetical protein
MLCCLASPTAAQDRIRYDTVMVEQRVLLTSDLTPAQARRRAIEEALAEAVRQVSGVLVRSGIVAVKEEQAGRIRDDYFSVVQLDAAGRATSYEVVDEGWVTTRHPALGEQVYLRLAVRSTIATELTAPDAGFTVDAWAGSSLLRVRSRNPALNDELVLGVQSSRPAWLTVLTVDGDSAAVVFPNSYVREVRVEAGDSIQVPAEEWRARGLKLRAELPAGVDSRRELVVVVATREPPPPFNGSSTMDLQRWLLTIPVEQRALKWLAIETRRHP